MSSRLETLLDTFGLSDRLYRNEVPEGVIPEKWDSVETILDFERSKAKGYIESAVRKLCN